MILILGNWNDDVRDCLPKNCSALVVDNGSVDVTSSAHKNGTILTVTCDHNFVISGRNFGEAYISATLYFW